MIKPEKNLEGERIYFGSQILEVSVSGLNFVILGLGEVSIIAGKAGKNKVV